MTSAALMEILVSLTVQISVILLVTDWLTRRHDNPVTNDRMWSLAYGLILAVSGYCLLIPHFRWIAFSSLAPRSWQPQLFDALEQTSRYLSLLWLTGCGLYLGLLVVSLVRGAFLIRRSPALSTIADDSLRHCPDSIRFKTSSHVSSPFLWQLHQPTIVLPSQVLKFDAGTLQAILDHEVVHFRAGHPLRLFLQRLVEIVFWYHPLVWRASRKAALHRELRCDFEAIKTAAQAESLINGLILLLEARRATPNSKLSRLNFLGTSTSLETRTAKLLARFESAEEHPERPQPFHSPALLLLAVSLFVFSVCWLPVNPEASQRSHFSPWPAWSASAIDLFGISVRDYEVDAHRLQPH